MWHNIYVKPKNKADKEREGADRVAEIMYAALTKLPKTEQKDAVKAIQAIKINVNRSKVRPSVLPFLRVFGSLQTAQQLAVSTCVLSPFCL